MEVEFVSYWSNYQASKCYCSRKRSITRIVSLPDFGEFLFSSNLLYIDDDTIFSFHFLLAAGAGGFDAHTDAPAYQHSGAIKHLTINIAVDEANMANGCLEVVDGSHRM